MSKRFLVPGLLLLSLFGVTLFPPIAAASQAASPAGSRTLVLYDAASGTVPSESLLDFTDFPPGAASQTYADNTTMMDTTLSGSDSYAGWVSGQAIASGFPILDRTAGIQVDFTLQVESEMHGRDHRAGFSVILLDKDAVGIELAFWENEVWAQNDGTTGGLFTHGEGTAFATTGDLVNYQVLIAGDEYTLTANAQPLLSGPVRNYSAFEGFPDPYETQNFLFLGDNTTAAQARVRLGFVSVTGTESEPVTGGTTSTVTSSPLPAASPTPAPSLTPIPSPATAPARGRVSELCSSGWLLLVVAVTGTLLSRRIGR